MQNPSLFPFHTHTTVWLPSLLCHFEFSSHLFHGLIRASDDRRMRWGERGGGGGCEGKGEGQGARESPSRVVAREGKLKTRIVNLPFEHCSLKLLAPHEYTHSRPCSL